MTASVSYITNYGRDRMGDAGNHLRARRVGSPSAKEFGKKATWHFAPSQPVRLHQGDGKRVQRCAPPIAQPWNRKLVQTCVFKECMVSSLMSLLATIVSPSNHGTWNLGRGRGGVHQFANIQNHSVWLARCNRGHAAF